MDYKTKLNALSASGNLRHISSVRHDGRWIWDGTHRMLNLSSNDYLGLASEPALVSEFLDTCPQSSRIFSSSSSRLLTGNFEATEELEDLLARAYCRPAALLFNSGYHANTGILPALAEKDCLILADKLVHASLIDGLKLSPAPFLRYRHQDMEQLERIVAKESPKYRLVFIVVESIYSMDGDVTDLRRLSALRKRYKNICLYVDEAHAIGVRGPSGLGIAEEQGVISDIDILVGTFGKALASVGGFTVCSNAVRDILVNRMRPFIFSTALPPVNWMWTAFMLGRMSGLKPLREHLASISLQLCNKLKNKGFKMVSESQIIPLVVGDSQAAVKLASALRDASVEEKDTAYLRVHSDRDDGMLFYDVRFSDGSYRYEYDIADNGTIVSKSVKMEAKAADDSAISQDEAESIALSLVDGATADDMRIRQDWDDGRMTYEGSIYLDGFEYEFEIDGRTGRVIDFERDRVRRH